MQWENWSVYWDQKVKRRLWRIDARQPNVSSGWVQYEMNITPNSRKPNFFPLHSVTWTMSWQRRLSSSFMPSTWMGRMPWSSAGHGCFKLTLWESRGIFPMIVTNSFQGPHFSIHTNPRSLLPHYLPTWVSKVFMVKGQANYCRLVCSPHMVK